MARTPARLRALAVALTVAATLAPANAFAALDYPGVDASAVTPVERYLAANRLAADTSDQDDQLRNFSHVFNFPFRGKAAGTDIEFYTPLVPRRDYTTGAVQLDENGQPIVEERDFAIVGSYNEGAWVFDITDPENTQFVRNIKCGQTQNDVQIKQFGERWILALAKDGNSGRPCVKTEKGERGKAGIAVFDITDPFEPQEMYSFGVTNGAHNFTFHPTKPFGYVSTGDIPGGVNHVPIIDFTNVDSPTLAADPQIKGSPHDISFNADGSRAYLAAENNMAIWDTTDPKTPREVSLSAGPASYVHGADPTPDGKHVIFTDESLVLGGFFTGRKAVCPGGGITLYNIEGSNEQQPRPVGFGVADEAPQPTRDGACTAHVGRITPNSKFYVTGWYSAGARVFDISNPSKPTDIGHAEMAGTEVWAAKFHKGNYVYTGDMRRGFDVFRWNGPDLGLPPVGGAEAELLPTVY